MAVNQTIRYNLSSTDLIGFPEIMHMIDEQDIKCCTAFELILRAMEELSGKDLHCHNY